jgi:hypothetical protein
LVARKLASLRAVAAAVGKHLSVFRTNLRSTIHRSVPWGPLGHGFALGASALLMESHFSRIHIAASLDLRDLLPWGSHPATDPLMSTSLLRFHHHGIEHGRLEKLAFLARHGFALRSLQVCYHDRVQENCGHCEKCYRTLIALEILDARPLATSFPADAFRLDQIPRIHMPDEFVRGRFRELLEHARTRGRTDLCAVMEESLRWNEKVDRIARGAGAIGRIPGLARLGLSLQRRARRLMARHAIG